jgi:glycine betaine/proline transport system permease protein
MVKIAEALHRRWVQALIVLVVWMATATALKGVQTQELSTASDSPFTAFLREVASAIRGNRADNPIFVYFFNPIRAFISGFIEIFMGVIAIPAKGDLIPMLGWFGAMAGIE